MKTPTAFSSRGMTDTGEIVKVLLTDCKLYHQTYKDVKFFVYHGVWFNTWDAVELNTGSGLSGGCKTKKQCITNAQRYIDNRAGIVEEIARVEKRYANNRILTIDECKKEAHQHE